MCYSFVDLFRMTLESLELKSLTTHGVITLCVQVALCEYDVADFCRKLPVAVVSQHQMNLNLLAGCDRLRRLRRERPANCCR